MDCKSKLILMVKLTFNVGTHSTDSFEVRRRVCQNKIQATTTSKISLTNEKSNPNANCVNAKLKL